MPKPKEDATPGAGHNVGGVDSHRLLTLIQRIVRLETEKRDAAESIKEVYAEAKSAGYAVPALRVVVREQLETDEQRTKRRVREENADILRHALGVLVGTDLGAAALERAGQ